MENETMLNAENLGFDAEDLKEAGLDNQESATPAGKAPAKESVSGRKGSQKSGRRSG